MARCFLYPLSCEVIVEWFASSDTGWSEGGGKFHGSQWVHFGIKCQLIFDGGGRRVKHTGSGSPQESETIFFT